MSLSDLPINPPAPDVVTYTKVDENAPLSLPPSPFLSKEIYLQCHKNGLEQELVARQKEALETTALLKKANIDLMDKIVSDISSSEDELLTGEHIENNYSPLERDFKLEPKQERDDDQMSLSSLSSTEQKIEESKVDIMQQPPMPSGHFAYQQYPGGFHFKFLLLCSNT